MAQNIIQTLFSSNLSHICLPSVFRLNEDSVNVSKYQCVSRAGVLAKCLLSDF